MTEADELISWNVKVQGVGGPMAEFWDRIYQVRVPLMTEAVKRALEAYALDDEHRRTEWIERCGDSHDARKMHEIIGVKVWKGNTVTVLR